MAKANFSFPNGTVVHIDGSTDEIERLIAFYSGSRLREVADASAPGRSPVRPASPTGEGTQPDLIEIVNLIRSCDESQRIESAILDRPNVLHRVLLPMFVVHAQKQNAFGLTSGEINKVTVELGVPVSQPHVSTCLSGAARVYVIGDKMRVKGHAVRYRLNRRGVQYIEQILSRGAE
jgi:hypothetical protein